MKKAKVFLKYFGVVLGGLLIAVIFLGVLGYSLPKVRSFVFQLREAKYNREYYKMMEERETALRNDNVGGKTPEETIQMFIEALEKRDVESIRNMYSIDDREEIYENEDNISVILVNVKKIVYSGEKRCSTGLSDTEVCSWILAQENGLDMVIGVERNPYTEVWKLIR